MYDLDLGAWVYLNPLDKQFVHGYAPANGWAQLKNSGLNYGWTWFAWPFAYDWDGKAWFYINETDSQWVGNMTSGRWSKMGISQTPPGMALIPAGDYVRGDSFGEGEADERPARSIYVSAFYMDNFEVSNSLWNDVASWANSRGYGLEIKTGAANLPTTEGNWSDAVKWCNARSEREGLTPCYYTKNGQVYRMQSRFENMDIVCDFSASGYRLPTEAEWEKAARGGAVNKRFPWPDSNTIQHSRANYFSKSTINYDSSATRGVHPSYGDNPSPVGAFAPNGYGMYDVAGNVVEWCWDWYSDSYYSISSSVDPRGPTAMGTMRVARGGFFSWLASACRVSARWPVEPETSSGANFIGFRCARTP